MQSFENRGSKFQSPNIQMGALTLRVSQSRSVKGRSGAEGNTLITGTEAKLCGQGLQAVHRDRKHTEEKRRKGRAQLGRQEAREEGPTGRAQPSDPRGPRPAPCPLGAPRAGLADKGVEGMNPPPVFPAGQPPLPSF